MDADGIKGVICTPYIETRSWWDDGRKCNATQKWHVYTSFYMAWSGVYLQICIVVINVKWSGNALDPIVSFTLSVSLNSGSINSEVAEDLPFKLMHPDPAAQQLSCWGMETRLRDCFGQLRIYPYLTGGLYFICSIILLAAITVI